MTRPSRPSLLDCLLRTVADSLDAYTSGLFVRIGSEKLRLVAWHSLSDNIDEGAELAIGEGPVGWVMREQRSLNIARFKQDSRVIGIYLADVGLKSFMAVPLPEEAGVLMADSKTRLKFTDKHLKILSSFAMCSVGLLKASRLASENRLLFDLLEWDGCSRSDFEDSVKKLMKGLSLSVCLVLRRVEGKNFFKVESVVSCDEGYDFADCVNVVGKRWPLDSGVCGWIFRHGEDILLKDFGTDPGRRVLLKRDERLGPKETILGLFFPATSDDFFRIDHALVFAGDADTTLWPEGLLQILKRRLERMVPWR